MLPDDRSAGFSGPLFNYVKACVAPCPQMTHIWVQTPNPIICAIWPEVIIVERSGGMAMLLLAILVGCVTDIVDGAVPRAGGAGYALSFDGIEGTTVSMKWEQPPTTKATVEYWALITDGHLTQQPLVAYSAYSVSGRYGAGGAAYENANEFVLLHAPTYFRLFHSTSNQNIGFDGGGEPLYDAAVNNYWTHIAVTWAADPNDSPHGQMAYYGPPPPGRPPAEPNSWLGLGLIPRSPRAFP